MNRDPKLNSLNSHVTCRWMHCLAGLAGLLAGVVALHHFVDHAVAAGTRTDAHWIWTTANRQPQQDAYFRRSFSLQEPASRVRLVGVADFCRAKVYVNGQQVADVEPFSPRLDLDVTRHLVAGDNTLAIHARSVSGPAAVFVHLERTDATDTTHIMVSDASWQASDRPEDGWLGRDFAGEPWRPAVSLGRVAANPWGELADDIRISPLDDYTQWKQAIGGTAGNDVASFRLQPGFEIELLRLAEENEGSWVSMAFDPRGRLVLAREDRGLLRLTLPEQATQPIHGEAIDDKLEECRGLLFAHDSLYANANNSKALYRLRDTNGDDRLDESRLLLASTGGVGHGRNDLALGPDGWIYTIHGDSVDMPRDFPDRTSPLREQRRGENTSEGHVLRIAPDGARVEVIAAGLRNPYGIDFNPEGELFTYDADAEFDMGAPWYRPTRVDHLVSGADFGWRGVTGKWPPYYPDHPENAQPTLDIGKGSPTAVRFGTRSHFPGAYRQALFILDWAYGRIVAVHLEPRGSSYGGRAETFLRGQPLNVTDLDFGPDGAMYFVTGGRATRSALYRVRYTGPAGERPAPTVQQQARWADAEQARALRRRLESLHGLLPADGKSGLNAASGPDATSRAAAALDIAWPYLDAADPALRYAARIAVEHQPLSAWRARALSEDRPTAAVTALLALARCQQLEVNEQVLVRLATLPIAEGTTSQKQAALHVYWLCLQSMRKAATQANQPTEAVRRAIVAQLLAMYPADSYAVNQPLSRVLAELNAPTMVAPTMELLWAADEQAERLHYLFVLRDVRQGWTIDLRRAYLRALNDCEAVVGGQGMPGFLQQIRQDFLAGLDENDRRQLVGLLKPPASPELGPLPESRPVVQEWTLQDLLTEVSQPSGERDFGRGRELFGAALCSRCHRVRDQGVPIGPDLTAVGNRFSRRDLLLSILVPSQVVAENYRSVRIVTRDGKTIVGRVVPGGDYRSPSLTVVTDPLRPDKVTTVLKSEIESHDWSALSTMPTGLLNSLERQEILDLLAYLEAGGDPRHPVFQRHQK